jgi:hypothetical protein
VRHQVYPKQTIRLVLLEVDHEEKLPEHWGRSKPQWKGEMLTTC